MNVQSLPLTSLAEVVRSKNAGPFELTLDVIFRDMDTFKHVEREGVFNSAMIAGLYGISEQDILGIVHYEPARAVKITLRRDIASGSIGDRDVYGAQQHAPLLTIEIPVPSNT